MSERPFRATASSARRTTGLLIAAAFLLIAAGIILFVAIGHGGSDRGQPLPGNVVDIGQAPVTTGSSDDPNQIHDTKAARLQFVDKQDPNRLASELSYEKLNPVGPGYYTLTQPRAWVYMQDGRILYVRADGGRVRMPSKMTQPESGEFRGNVVVRMFAPREVGAPPVDPDHDMPSLVALTDSVSFDSALLELSTQDVITVTAPNLHFEGEGLLVRGNQVKERIELLRTKGRYVRYNPKLKVDRPAHAREPAKPAAVTATAAPADKSITSPPATPSASSESAAASAVTAPSPAPARIKEQLYKAIFSDAVVVTESTRRLDADTLEIFARTIDNRLPDNAFGTPIAASTQPVPATGPSTAANPPSKAPDAASAPAAPAPAAAATNTAASGAPTNLFQSAGDEDIVLRWTGSLVLKPLTDAGTPKELDAGNHFAARFSADKLGGASSVTFTDSAKGARGECAAIEYAATSRTISLLSGQQAPNVVFDAPDAGQLVVPNASVSLLTGVAQVRGPGQLTAVRAGKTLVGPPAPIDPAAPQQPLPADLLRQITWADRADFQFRLENGRVGNSLDWAEFAGSVLARDRTSAIGGTTLRADFGPVGTQASALKRLRVQGNAIAVAGPRTIDPDRPQPTVDPFISCENLEVAFAPSKIDPNDVDPVRGVAHGFVKAGNKDATIRAQRMEADLGRDDKRVLVATDVVARSDPGSAGVQVDRVDGVSARCDELRAHPVLRTAVLIGQTVALARGNSTILAKEVELDDAAGTMHVFGAGSLEHLQIAQSQLADASSVNAAAAPDPTRVHAEWKRSMLFDNTRGTVECLGECVVSSTSALQTQTLRAEKLRLWMTPASQSESHPAASSSPVAPGEIVISDTRKLLRAEAIGASEDREGAPLASVETRRYSAPIPPSVERTLEQVFYIDAPRILADDVKGTITVPTAGRCIARDQRAATTTDHMVTGAGMPLTSGGARGTSKFTWAESMEFTRSTGVLTMKKDVELIHLPLGAKDVTRLVAMQIDAKFNMDKMTSGASNRSAELVRADATGAVYAENGQQRLLADAFGYDALAGTAEASAGPASRVTLYDDRKGTQLVARRLFWDLVHDRIEVREPAPITSPR